MSESLYGLLIAFSLLVTYKLLDSASIGWAILLGVLVGPGGAYAWRGADAVVPAARAIRPQTPFRANRGRSVSSPSCSSSRPGPSATGARSTDSPLCVHELRRRHRRGKLRVGLLREQHRRRGASSATGPFPVTVRRRRRRDSCATACAMPARTSSGCRWSLQRGSPAPGASSIPSKPTRALTPGARRRRGDVLAAAAARPRTVRVILLRRRVQLWPLLVPLVMVSVDAVVFYGSCGSASRPRSRSSSCRALRSTSWSVAARSILMPCAQGAAPGLSIQERLARAGRAGPLV